MSNNTTEAEGSCWGRQGAEHVGIRAGTFWPRGSRKGPPQGRSTVKRDEMQALVVLQGVL